MEPANTPLVKQYLAIKKDYTDVLVFFRLGDFYELFFDDAIIAAKLLQITLTKKAGNENIPMCGVPHHAVLPYIKKLINLGHKVAIAEQVSPPGKGLVERKVTQVITPGQVIDFGILDQTKNNFLGALSFLELGYMLSYLDLSTGEGYVRGPFSYDELCGAIKNLTLKEVILGFNFDKQLLAFLSENRILVNYFSDSEPRNNNKLLTNLILPAEKKAASLLLNYLNLNQKMPLGHLLPFEVLHDKDILKLDYQFFNHLEIFTANFNNDKYTLLNLLDNTQTAQGARLLRYEMLKPLKDLAQIKKRQQIIKGLMHLSTQEGLKKLLAQIYDINRILSRLVAGKGLPRDLIWLRDSLRTIPLLITLLKDTKCKPLEDLLPSLTIKEELLTLLNQSLSDNPSPNLSEGGIFKNGYDEKLDRMREEASGNSLFLKNYEEAEKQRLNLKNLKIGVNSVFGYYLEISKANLREIDATLLLNYERKQTLTNCERYTTAELKQYERNIFNLNDQIIAYEQQLFKMVVDNILQEIIALQTLSKTLATIDFYLALSITALKQNYVCPTFNQTGEIKLMAARHPVVEQYTKIIKNDITLSPQGITLITGPNMGGKSTYMRTCALIIYLAHLGSFVPCDEASLPLYDNLYTRIGASDNIAAGLSTFMLEMSETKNALAGAGKNSFLFFDEIGRGTATYDGIALAASIIYYVNKLGAQMLFATHYHELVALTQTLPNINNIHAHADKVDDKMLFSYKMMPGAISRSYGIEVAALAGLPNELINNAQQLLQTITKNTQTLPALVEPVVTSIKTTNPIIKELKQLNLDAISPLEALNYLANLKKRYSDD